MDRVEWISREKQGNALKYFCVTAEILPNCSLTREISESKIREGDITASTVKQQRVLGTCM